jgi:L-ascorbate metabolism protein UlaG (beta-lactamase superfamily)
MRALLTHLSRDPAALAALALLGAIAPSGACAQASQVHITPYVGAGIQIEYQGTVIHVDPWRSNGRADYSSAKPGDLILITDTATDHLDPVLIAQLRKVGAQVVLSDRPEEVRNERERALVVQVPDAIVMDNGDELTLAGVGIEAVPMYDIIPGDPFHAKGEGNGYILTLGDNRVYVAGVTECVPEIQPIRDIDIMFVPMNLPNGRMTTTDAANCVKMIRPRVVYPYHYREMPIDAFVEALRGERDIEVRVHVW